MGLFTFYTGLDCPQIVYQLLLVGLGSFCIHRTYLCSVCIKCDIKNVSDYFLHFYIIRLYISFDYINYIIFHKAFNIT